MASLVAEIANDPQLVATVCLTVAKGLSEILGKGAAFSLWEHALFSVL